MPLPRQAVVQAILGHRRTPRFDFGIGHHLRLVKCEPPLRLVERAGLQTIMIPLPFRSAIEFLLDQLGSNRGFAFRPPRLRIEMRRRRSSVRASVIRKSPQVVSLSSVDEKRDEQTAESGQHSNEEDQEVRARSGLGHRFVGDQFTLDPPHMHESPPYCAEQKHQKQGGDDFKKVHRFGDV